MIVAQALEIFGPRLGSEECDKRTSEADADLASWYLDLPDSLRYDASRHNHWAAQLMLIYHNILILLHRATESSRVRTEAEAMHSSTGSRESAAINAEICNASTQAIVSIFENLCANDEIRYIWLDGANALLMALTHLAPQLETGNPIVALTARRTFESGLRALRAVAEWWPIENAVVELFESGVSSPTATRDVVHRVGPCVEPYLSNGDDRPRQQMPTAASTRSIHAQDGIAALLQASTADGPGERRPNAESTIAGVFPDERGGGCPDWRDMFPFSETEQLHSFAIDQALYGDAEVQWADFAGQSYPG